MMKITPQATHWDNTQYELLDSGGGYKLERFGSNVLVRPEPQALWMPTLTQTEWRERASAIFTKTGSDGERGNWDVRRGVAEQWWVSHKLAQGVLKMRLGLTSFKHVGLFSEQASNWDYVQRQLASMQHKSAPINTPKLLNMFAYTGAASVAAALAGAEVTHLDSVKVVNTWARENAEASGISSIRYITDDAMAFTLREVRRGNKYSAIILDPPAYGRGPDGQKWVLEEQIYELLSGCAKLLEAHSGAFILLSLYSMGLSPIVAHTVLSQILGDSFEIEALELYISDPYKKNLPLGVTLRAVRR